MGSYLQLRQIMAENGYETTPAEAKRIVDKANAALEKLTEYESYLSWKNMDEDDLVANVKWYNKQVKKKDRMTLDEFKDLRQLIIDIAEGN